jgi:hypothetical protein
MSKAARSAVLSGVSARLDSLNDNCVTNLAASLEAFQDGDLRLRVTPVTTPVEERSGDADIDAIADKIKP